MALRKRLLGLRRSSTYEAFVSYKSHDSHLARRITDLLIASGTRVWFAEYQILLRNRDRFEEAIEDGIRRSTHGLALTNDRYITSAHCRSELSQLLRHPGAGRVLEIAIPEEDDPHREFPELAGSPHCSGDTLETIFSFVEQQTGWNLPPVRDDGKGDAGALVEGRCMGVPYTIDSSGWTLIEPGGEVYPEGTVKGPVLTRELGARRVFVNVFAGRESSENARRQEATADDREMYDELIDYLPSHVGRVHAKIKGLHLLFHSNLSQMAVTYRRFGYWTRKHSIILPHPDGHGAGEVVFAFGFRGPFAEYCRYAHVMDELALWLRWPG